MIAVAEKGRFDTFVKKVNLRKRIGAPLTAIINRIMDRSSSHEGYEAQRVIRKQDREPPVIMENKLLWGKNVLITGAGRNIGKSIALEMAQQGANIFFTDIDMDKCVKLEQELHNLNVKGKGFVSDISKTKDSDCLYDFLVQANVTIDILVNNVGIHCEKEGIDHIHQATWEKTFHTNVLGPMYLTKLISQMMRKNGIFGSIIFISSIHQFTPSRSMSYSSSKAALGIIIKELAIELAAQNIRVNGIAPGWVKVDEQGNPYTFTFAPLHGSTIHPCYIGRAAVYLASDFFSGFTTGALITIDAGLSLHNRLLEPYPPDKSH